MPSLSLMPSLAGTAPATTTAKVNDGTEGREGENTASTNSGDTKETWTRLFKSYLDQTQEGAGTVPIQQSGTVPANVESSQDSLQFSTPTANISATTVLPNAAGVTIVKTALLKSAATSKSTSTPLVTTANGSTSHRKATLSSSPDEQPYNVSYNSVQPAATPLVPVPLPIPTATATAPNETAVAFATAQFSSTALSGSAVAKVVVSEKRPLSSYPSASSVSGSRAVAQTTKPTGPLVSSVSTVVAASAAVPAAAPSNLPTGVRNSRPGSLPVRGISSASRGQTQVLVGEGSGVSSTDQVSSVEPTTTALPEEAQSALANAETTVASTSVATTAAGVPNQPSSSAKAPPGAEESKSAMVRDQVLGVSPATARIAHVGKGSSQDPEESTAGDANTDGSKSVSPGQGSSSIDGATAVGSSSSTALTSSSQATALVQTSSHEERVAVVNQIAQHIQSMQPAGESANTMTVTVQPPHWGEVKIAVSLDSTAMSTGSGTAITASVTASTPEVQGVLQQHVQDLKDALTGAGLHLDKLDVGLSAVTAATQSGGATAHHQGQHQGNSGGQGFQGGFTDGSMSSTGSQGQYQSAGDWGAGDDSDGPPSSIGALAPVTSTSSGAQSAGTNNSTRIDMRA